MTEDMNTDAATAEAVAEMNAETKATQERNDAALAALAAQGVRVDPSMVLNARLALLLDRVLGPQDGPDATVERAMYERDCQATFTRMIDNIQSQIRQAQIMAGVGNGHLPPMPGRG